eukprot:TRINITY_DN891_c0_g1_i1.p1 TRINITY_DN891_c0_g1~~TRINITY_DN891_c0_g1_i1.p1  ORF type:complete len:200 (+),score=35.27 TRINITY_DN891_c0_g1_i1:604-1203(+)
MTDSPENSKMAPYWAGYTIESLFKPGVLLVADLTDALIDQRDANRVFQVVVGLFMKSVSQDVGKLIVFDEAHKYLSTEIGDLCDDIVTLVRQMRHNGTRIVVSTQSPHVLHRELFELSSFVVLHRFTSPDWFNYLSNKMRLPEDAQDEISSLETGNALVFCSQSDIGKFSDGAMIEKDLFRVLIRPRLTQDCGQSVLNL